MEFIKGYDDIILAPDTNILLDCNSYVNFAEVKMPDMIENFAEFIYESDPEEGKRIYKQIFKKKQLYNEQKMENISIKSVKKNPIYDSMLAYYF